ncbi:MAG TPA: IS982 family transposase [Trebonia sp.]|nr:IS982 family transposase [Trebonia sp.]
MEENLDTLAIALYVKIDDDREGLARLPGRPPALSHSELICLAVMQAMLGFESESRFLRYAKENIRHLFPFIPLQPGYNKRLRAALPQIKAIIRTLGRDTDFWEDHVWIVDSTPVPCGTSRPAVKRSEMGGWANYGYCASHSRWFWGLRLYLVCTPAGLPVLWALADPKIGEREVLEAMIEIDADLIAERNGILLISDKGFAGGKFEQSLSEAGITLLRPSRKDEAQRPGEPALKKVRQLIESVNDTFKGQLDLEQHAGRTFEGTGVRVAQRVLALTAAIWHNFQTGQEVMRSLTAYDH